MRSSSPKVLAETAGLAQGAKNLVITIVGSKTHGDTGMQRSHKVLLVHITAEAYVSQRWNSATPKLPNTSCNPNQIQSPRAFMQGNRGTQVFVELGRHSTGPANHPKGEACQNRAAEPNKTIVRKGIQYCSAHCEGNNSGTKLATVLFPGHSKS